MKHRILMNLALLLIAAMLLPCLSLCEEAQAPVVEHVEELPEFELTEPEIQTDSLNNKTTEDESAFVAAPEDQAELVEPKSSTTKLTLGRKETYRLEISNAKKYATSDKSIATVSSKGVITAKAKGKATITVTKKDGSKVKVKVTVLGIPDNVTLNKTEATVTIGKTLKLKATLSEGTASNKLTWKSSKKSVATVDANGVVTAVKAGTAKITVKTFNGKTATCTVTVKKPAPKKVVLNETEATMIIGDKLELAATLEPEGASSKLIWTSSKPEVAKVSTKGKVTALKAGTATITVTTANGKKAKCKITVAKPVSADKSKVSLNAGDKLNVKITYLNDNTLCWDIEDTNIAYCKWVDGWDGDTCELTIVGLDAGTTTVTVYDEVTNDSVNIKVTVKGHVEKVTELIWLLGKDIRMANAMLANDVQLIYNSEKDYYYNDYFMVWVDDDNTITSIGYHRNYGAYTLSKQWPGRSLSYAVKELSNFEIVSNEDNYVVFKSPDVESIRLGIGYSNGKVSYIFLYTV